MILAIRKKKFLKLRRRLHDIGAWFPRIFCGAELHSERKDGPGCPKEDKENEATSTHKYLKLSTV
jgi:hypothetical protein